MASDFRCLLLSPENAPFDESEIFQGFIKKFQGFSRVSRDFQGFKKFPGFSRISRARTNPGDSMTVCFRNFFVSVYQFNLLPQDNGVAWPVTGLLCVYLIRLLFSLTVFSVNGSYLLFCDILTL